MRRGLIALLLLLAALPLACGGGEAVDPEVAVAQAATKTADAGSSRLSFEASMSGGGLPRAVEFAGEGEFDYEARRGRIAYDLGQLLPGGGGEPVEVLLEGVVVFVRLPGAAANQLPEGKEWLRIDLDEIGRQAGVDIGALSQLNQGDPSQVLMYLRGATDGIEEVGEEEVRGTATTHYRGDVDLRKAAELAGEELPADAREQVRKGVDRLIQATGTRTIPLDVWIDDDGRARRLRVDFDLQMPGATERAAMEIEMELYDFGVAVDVEPPPAKAVVDLQDLIARESGSGAGSS